MRLPINTLITLIMINHANANSMTIQHDIPITLAQTYHADTIKQQTYYVSEKFDGIRAIWTGAQLITRSGHVIQAPKWFIEHLPAEPLDGELWSKHHDFNFIQSTVLDQTPNESQWQQIVFMVFDMPSLTSVYAERYARLKQWQASVVNPYIELVVQYELDTHTAIMAFYQSILQRGGEGIMLRDPHAAAIDGRQPTLKKLKPFDDAEATIIGYRQGKGELTGLLGAYLVKTDQGVVFAVGSGLKRKDRENPLPIGTQITYRYQGITDNGKPRFARYLRARLDHIE